MKTTILTGMVVFALTLSVLAEEGKLPVSRHLAGDASAITHIHNNTTLPVTPPALCNPCIFYGGDNNPNDINSAGMSDENTLLITGGSATYSAVTFPSHASVIGIMFNIQASDAFDPKTATYDIRENVSDGNGGFSVQSGSATVQIVQTGRNIFGLFEYSIAVHFPTVTLEPGVEYWFNVEPQCLNGAQDGSCFLGRFFVSNTTQGTNNFHGSYQPEHSMFLNSSFFGFDYTNWCDASLGFNQGQCNLMSYGLMGTISH